jgi:hypothetical protein
MRKTISLRLTPQEEILISSMRNKGISPSLILREAIKKYIHENQVKNIEKPYKGVNHVNQFSKENENQTDRNVYNMVNQVNQNVNHQDDFLREKVVYQPVNHVNKPQDAFLDQYINQLQAHIQQLESELHDWKMRYTAETQYWKEAYHSLQIEYQNYVKDSTKRIDDKFDRIMFYIEESRKSPMNTLDISSDAQSEKQKKKWTSYMVRM